MSLSRRNLLVLLLIFAALWFGQLGYRKLVKPDEGRYAEISREMAATGNWVTPRLNGIKYFEKPAMQYWATAAAYNVFGENEFSARFWTGLTGFGGILLTWLAARRLFGQATALRASLVLGSAFFYFALGHINTLDMGVSFFMQLGLTGFLLAQRDEASPGERRNGMLLTWAAMGCAMLSKGLIGVALPGAVLVLYVLLSHQWEILRRLNIIKGLLVFLLVAAPWFVVVSQKNPEFFHFFFIHEHVERFLKPEHHRLGPWWYFVPILMIGIMPWVSLLPASLWRAAKKESGRHFQPRLLLLIWCVFIFLFFSKSTSKLPAYILPIFPALALLMGDYLAHIDTKQLRRHAIVIVLLAASLFLAMLLAPQWIKASEDTPMAMQLDYLQWLRAGASVWLLGALCMLGLAIQARNLHSLLAIASASAIAWTIMLCGHNTLARSNSAYYLAQDLKPHLRPGVPLYSVGMYDQTLPFYLRRTMTLVNYRDELSFGLDQEPHLWIHERSDFRLLWEKQPYALALMNPQTYKELQEANLPMTILTRDTRRIVVANR